MPTAMKEKLTAINKWMFFIYNYPHNFIESIWGNEPWLMHHLKGKFNAYYEDYGPYGVIPKFYAELDSSNKVQMMTWVMENFNEEQKLNIN